MHKTFERISSWLPVFFPPQRRVQNSPTASGLFIFCKSKMARSCEDLRTGETESNPFLFSNFMKKDSTDNVAAQVWKNFDSSNESVDHAPFPDLCRLGEFSIFGLRKKPIIGLLD